MRQQQRQQHGRRRRREGKGGLEALSLPMEGSVFKVVDAKVEEEEEEEAR